MHTSITLDKRIRIWYKYEIKFQFNRVIDMMSWSLECAVKLKTPNQLETVVFTKTSTICWSDIWITDVIVGKTNCSRDTEFDSDHVIKSNTVIANTVKLVERLVSITQALLISRHVFWRKRTVVSLVQVKAHYILYHYHSPILSSISTN
jgi:hypothetical protein